jgi:hypothetical protein
MAPDHREQAVRRLEHDQMVVTTTCRAAGPGLGHADVRTTLAIYAQATSAADRAAADALGSAFQYLNP